jgi:hypothetical protein
MSPDITPISKVWHHDVQGSPGGCQICSSERDGVEDGSIDMADCSWVFVMEFLNIRSCMELVVHLPAVVTIIISLPLDQVFKVIVPHSTIEDCFNFIFLFTIDEC